MISSSSARATADAEHVLKVLNVWLAPRGLTLSEQKTRITHPTQGLDFLGCNVRHYALPT